MSETATTPKLTVQVESASPTLNPTLTVAGEKTKNAKKLANALLTQELRNRAKQYNITLSDEECINIINDLEEEINKIKENDLEPLGKLFDEKIQQLLKNPRPMLALKIDDSEAQTQDALAALEAGQTDLEKKDAAGVEAAVVVNNTANTNQDNINFLYLPLRTSRETLIEFAKEYAKQHDEDHEEVLKRLNMASAIGSGPEWEIFAINDYIIRNMDFSMYWEMRSFQMQRIQDELTTLLNLQPDETGELKEKGDISYKIDRFIRNPFKDTLNEYEKKVYLQKMLEFLQGVSIEVIPNPTNQQEEAHITKTYDNGQKVDLVTITENTQTNKMNFSINTDLLKDSSEQGQKRLADAIELSIDQATRLLERNQDKSYKLTIEGYGDSPEMVLRMFYSAKLHGHQPEISAETTLKFWNDKINGGTSEEKTRYKKAMELYQALDQQKNIQKLRKDYEQKILQQQLGGHGATQKGQSSSNAREVLPITTASPTLAKPK